MSQKQSLQTSHRTHTLSAEQSSNTYKVCKFAKVCFVEAATQRDKPWGMGILDSLYKASAKLKKLQFVS